MPKYSIGLDYGTLSVRAVLVNIENGEEMSVSAFEYPHGVMETNLPTGERLPINFALQHPKDYIDGLVFTVRDVLENSRVKPEDVVAIGIDFTASTILPVKSDGTPLCMCKGFESEPHSYVKLWKYHGAEKEAEYIDIINQKFKEQIPFYGGKVSAEWMLPKVLETLNNAPQVYQSADRFMEAMDWIAWMLTGEETRSINGLGYKAFYNQETGFPPKDFFRAIDCRLENFVEEKMNAPIKRIGERTGFLTENMAKKLGLCAGIPIGVPMIDAQCCVLGGGVTKPGEMMIVAGTSFCHHILSEKETDVYGATAIVKDGILPEMFAYEAGQSGGGDIFSWFTKNCIPEKYVSEAIEKQVDIHSLLCEKLEDYRAGQSGLIALDWFNGVRSPLADYNLNGLILGLNLQTTPEEIYVALIESIGFGTRLIVEEFEKSGIHIESVMLSGGIPLKNPMLVQIFADILNRSITVCSTAQAGAVGAAILGIAAASSQVTGFSSLIEIVENIGKRGKKYIILMKKIFQPMITFIQIIKCYLSILDMEQIVL